MKSKKQSSDAMSSLAAKIMGGYMPTLREIKRLAACVLSQDEVRGKRESKK
jgi:hypothetical protein